ncbi:MAG: DUF2304 family protein [Candidatus Woesearchaeota archaeon]
MLGIQIIGVLFGLFMLYITFLHNKRKEFTVKEGLVWAILWLGFIFITLFPTQLNYFVKDVLTMQRPLDFYIILGFIIIIGTLFHTYSLVRRLQKKTDDLVSKIAIGKEDNKEK